MGKPRSKFSDYIVYVDESGDHGLDKVDPNYPLFVLVFCIFRKDIYRRECSPILQEFKFKHFGHDMVVLHEREIRKAQKNFSILINRAVREEFMVDLNALVEVASFTLIASAINKTTLQQRYLHPSSPYDLALAFCLERLWYFLKDHSSEKHSQVHVVFESRGKKEDEELELVFRRVCDGANMAQTKLPFEPVFVPKCVNCGGMQIADLVARPIGRHLLAPNQDNRAYDIIEKKFRRSAEGQIRGWGLKVFP